MIRIIYMACLGILLVTVVCQGVGAQDAIWLITEKEAALPNKIKNNLQTDWVLMALPLEVNREEVVGPFIHVEAPDENKLYKQLIDILIRFEKNPLGEPVDMGSLKVIYQKIFDIDITDRILPYVRENQIDATKIKFPKGEHKVKIYIRDYDKMQSFRIIKVSVK